MSFYSFKNMNNNEYNNEYNIFIIYNIFVVFFYF